MPNCIICRKRSDTAEKRSLHGFPPDESLRKNWLESLKLTSVGKRDKVCCDHFSPDSFKVSFGLDQRVRLKADAVPQLHNYNNAKLPSYDDNMNSSSDESNDGSGLVMNKTDDKVSVESSGDSNILQVHLETVSKMPVPEIVEYKLEPPTVLKNLELTQSILDKSKSGQTPPATGNAAAAVAVVTATPTPPVNATPTTTYRQSATIPTPPVKTTPTTTCRQSATTPTPPVKTTPTPTCRQSAAIPALPVNATPTTCRQSDSGRPLEKRPRQEVVVENDADDDDDRMFMLSLARKMKYLSPADNMKFRLEVQDLLLDKLCPHPENRQQQGASISSGTASVPAQDCISSSSFFEVMIKEEVDEEPLTDENIINIVDIETAPPVQIKEEVVDGDVNVVVDNGTDTENMEYTLE